MLEINSLSKNYGKSKVLDNINCSLNKGQIVGLLGPSGSGKTTLMNIIAGITSFKQGNVLINGESPNINTKRSVSLLTETNSIPKWMKVKDVLDFYCEMYSDFNLDKFNNIFNDLNYSISYNKKIIDLSKGMTQLLRLALSISRKTKLYLLDEPLGGLDSLVREQVIDTIINYIDENSTIIIATHLIDEVERLLQKVIFIKDGQLLGLYDCDDLRIEKGQSIEKTFKEVIR
jgi:ABC-2 type transport system ATP-binding protein